MTRNKVRRMPLGPWWAVVFLSIAMAGCDTTGPVTNGGATSYSTLSLGRTAAVSRKAELRQVVFPRQQLVFLPSEISINFVEDVKVPPQADVDAMTIGGTGAASAGGGYAIGSAGFIYLGQALVASAMVMVPIAVILEGQASDIRAVGAVAKSYPFSRELRDNLVRRLGRKSEDGPPSTTAPGTHARIQLGLRYYGFVNAGRPPGATAPAPPCFVISARLSALIDNATVYQDVLEWGEVERSADLPPVRCAETAALAAKDGALAKRIMREATVVLAAAIERRLRGRPDK